MKKLVEKIYTQKNEFIVIGLTGKTGSGCTTVSEILKEGYSEYSAVNHNDKYIQQKKDRIIKSFASKHFIDKNFHIIKPSTIIMMLFIFEKSIFFNEIKELKKLLDDNKVDDNEIQKKCTSILNLYDIFINFDMENNKFKKDDDFRNLLTKYSKNNKDKVLEFIQEKKDKYEKRLAKQNLKNLRNEINKLFDSSIEKKDLEFKDLKFKKIKAKNKEKLREKFEIKRKIIDSILEKLAKNDSDIFINLYEKYNSIINKKRTNNELSIETLQKIGDLVRSQIDIFKLPKYINFMIKALRARSKKKKTYCYIAIDTLKNPFEIVFFKEKYSAFYIFSIHSQDQVIYDRFKESNVDIESIHLNEMNNSTTNKQKESLDSKEDFNSQNIIECIQRSDIYIDNNNDKRDSLQKQIYKYLSLIVHPGLITPSKDEMIMQIALNAKFNSGCISRQVGAVVLNKHDSVKSIGWNEVPEGQIPCNLRSHNELLNNSTLLDYSKYEKNKLRLTDAFKYNIHKEQNSQYMESNKLGLHDSFCFKQIQNIHDVNKNQVYTRSLHAEENAFLQLSKYGNTQIIEGQLFTTASPCFLCAKKAYQLGIKRIVYIEAYPDISNEQIFDCGINDITMIHFRGAIGLAYQKLYEPLFSYKDELQAINNKS